MTSHCFRCMILQAPQKHQLRRQSIFYNSSMTNLLFPRNRILHLFAYFFEHMSRAQNFVLNPFKRIHVFFYKNMYPLSFPLALDSYIKFSLMNVCIHTYICGQPCRGLSPTRSINPNHVDRHASMWFLVNMFAYKLYVDIYM